MESNQCPLCKDTKEVLRYAKRTMGYTLSEDDTEANTIDEHLEPCPLCKPPDPLT